MRWSTARRHLATELTGLGHRLLRSGRTRPGLVALEAGLRLTHRPTASDLLTAARHRLSGADVARAERWFEALDAAFPDRHEGAVGLARCAEKEGRWSAAADRWDSAAARFPGQARSDWHRRRELALRRAGRTAEAERARDLSWSDTPERRRYLRLTMGSPAAPTSPLRFDHVLIVTYGRSGSTLLQGLLNSIDGMLVRGENGNLVHDLYRTMQRIRDLRDEHGGASTPDRPWFGIGEVSDDVILGALRAAVRHLLLAGRPEESVRCLGFKEIRYADLGPELETFLAFLEELLPNCALIFNTRDPAATSGSAWWSERDPATVRGELARLGGRFASYAEGRENCFTIRHEDVLERSSRLKDLFEFLGAPFDEDRIDAVLRVPHSYVPRRS